MINSKLPIVSIGFPVFNGEHFLGESLGSILKQTFRDFELIICDNASTDGTENICREFSRKDDRIRYYRLKENIGAAPNFNKTFELSRGKYFKWAAHDDKIAPEFLEKCVKILDEDNGAVLAYTKTMIINANSRVTGPHTQRLPTNSQSVIIRFEASLRGHACYEIFGLIRRRALEKTPLMGSYAYGDGVLLARLAFYGRFEQIPEYLFFNRHHSEQSSAIMKDRNRAVPPNEFREFAAWFDPKLKNKMLSPYWKILFEYIRSVPLFRLKPYESLRCYKRIANWIYQNRSFLSQEIMNLWKKN